MRAPPVEVARDERPEARDHGEEGVALGGAGEGHRLLELVDDDQRFGIENRTQAISWAQRIGLGGPQGVKID